MEKEENRLIILKDAIQKGIESGSAKNFEPVKYLESLKVKKRSKTK